MLDMLDMTLKMYMMVSSYCPIVTRLVIWLQPKFQQDVPCADIKQAQACIIFINSRIKSPKWSCELLLVNYHAELRGFLVSPTDGYQENHTFSFSQHHRQGIVTVAYHPSHHLLFLAGPSALFSTSALKGLGSSMGLSAWRLLNDYPFYRLALSTDEEEALLLAHRSLWNWVPSFRRSRNHHLEDVPTKPPPEIIGWLRPCLRLYKFWSLREQPDYNVRNPLVERGKTRLTITPDDSEFHPIDINWWSDQAVIIARFCGAVSVCAVANLRNLLGESPEFLAGQPQVSALCNPQGFLSLECESLLTSNKRLVEEDEHWEETSVDESEEDESPLLSQGSAFLQSAVYLVTDMERFQPKRKRLRVLHRTYRLLGLKSTTPEELYSRKVRDIYSLDGILEFWVPRVLYLTPGTLEYRSHPIPLPSNLRFFKSCNPMDPRIDNEEYDEALSLARAYNLDCDQVYQRQWRNSEVSIDTIHNFLVRTDGGHFVLKSLKEETINQDDTSETDTPGQSLLDKINMESLTESQGDLIRYRRKLLQYLDMLCTYELILGGCHLAPDQYSHRFYAQFRDDPPLLSAVQFARESQPQAVGHLLTYHSDLVLPHWLPMLSNFPETMPPYEYRELLPECDPEGRVFPRPRKRLRNADWCEGGSLP
uniref:Neuroblastoma-amplified sequence N-terminal domain-containing protein n=1 Tax=Timema genevievae TaxID=629358 RepID=A0A7R9K6S8_TIMGE|nr:unnamed protein product [Timema genevievae]